MPRLDTTDDLLEDVLPREADAAYQQRFRADLNTLTVDLFHLAAHAPVMPEVKVFAALATVAQLARAVTSLYPSWAPSIRHSLVTVIAELDTHLAHETGKRRRRH